MKHTNKKGFTIVELVIVIAVIAILAAVLIPNLSRLVTKADKSAAMQEAKAAMDNDLINAEGDWSNMKYTMENDSENKLYYIVSSKTLAANSEPGETDYTLDGTTFKKATKNTETAVTVYTIEAFNGKYANETYSYTTNDKKFNCTFANGEWTVDEVAKAGN